MYELDEPPLRIETATHGTLNFSVLSARKAAPVVAWLNGHAPADLRREDGPRTLMASEEGVAVVLVASLARHHPELADPDAGAELLDELTALQVRRIVCHALYEPEPEPPRAFRLPTPPPMPRPSPMPSPDPMKAFARWAVAGIVAIREQARRTDEGMARFRESIRRAEAARRAMVAKLRASG